MKVEPVSTCVLKASCRNDRAGLFLGFILFACAILAAPLHAAQFGISATVQKSPAQITLSWDATPWGAANYTVYRSTTIGGSSNGAGTWTQIASGLTGTSFVDTNVQVGTEYEYRVNRSGSQFNGDAYLDTGIEMPLVDSRGKLILIVDNTYTTSLSSDIAQLQSDLAGDGWTVIRHDVSRTDTPASVRSLIQSDYNADRTNVKAVYLLGRVPVFRSGNYAPDGHDSRSMPADAYYGDMDGNWSSSPNSIPSDIELQVGRVDLYNMPSFSPLTDTDLTRQYLAKAHNFRHKNFTVSMRQAEMTSATGDSIQRQFFGTAMPTNIPNNYYADNGYYSPEFWNEVQNNDYMWFTKGTGGGQYTACTGMGSTYHYAASPGVKTVFNTTFASWFVEWDVQDNFLRAPLAAKGYALCNAWSDLPAWVFQHMGMGKNIGYSTRLSQNNNTYYNIIGYPDLPAQHRGVHIGLMGDPTLRMHIIKPVSNLVMATGSGVVNLSWTASTDSGVQGYAVYRSTSVNGPFTRLNATLATATSYKDSNVPSGSYVYMVRAVRLETVPSGSYFNASQGIFVNATVSGGTVANQAPVVNAGNAQTITLPASATLAGSAIDDGLPAQPGITTATWTARSGPGTVTFGNASSPTTTASFSASGTYVLRLTANDGVLSSYSEVTVTVNPARVNNPPVANSQSITMNVNAIRAIILTGSDPNGDPLTYSVTTSPTHGTLTGTSPNLTYTPNANYTGSDSFAFKVNDGLVDSSPATVSLTINTVTNTAGSDVIAVYHLDNDYSDGTGVHGNIVTANNAKFDSSNLSWMSTPSGSALRVFDVFDRGTVNIPLADINQGGQAVSISVEAQLFINRYPGYTYNNATLIGLVSGWNSQLLLSEDKWATSAAVIGGSQTIISAASLSSVLTTGRWHQVSITLNTNGYTVKVDGNQVAQLASGDLANWSGTGTATLQFGDFDGWVDEVVVRSSKPIGSTPTVTLAASDASASEVGNDPGAFTVSRSGSTAQALTVNFSVGGTARYGSNYSAIGSSVTIPAGANSAVISVNPIRDKVFTGPLTVSLALVANSLYQVGSPASGTVTITDADKPQLKMVATNSSPAVAGPPTQLQLSTPGVSGVTYILQSSTNLISWASIATNQTGAALNITTPISRSQTNVFYRLLTK
jgi:Bacterial Ig domain